MLFGRGLRRLIRQAFELGDLERSFGREKSLLLLVIESMAKQRWVEVRVVDFVLQAVNTHVRLWLKILYCAGVDLDQHRQQEYEYLKVNADNEIAITTDEEETLRHARLINMRDAREVFGKRDFHGWGYRPKVSREDCLAYCYKYSDCRYRPRLAG